MTNVARNLYDDVFTEQSFCDGQKLEKYVEDYIFPDRYYEILEKTHKYSSKRYVRSNLNPDFKFEARDTGFKFWLEVKYRSYAVQNKVEWCSYSQLKRYRQLQKYCPVYILIGLGGSAADPEYVFLISLTDAKYTGLYASVLMPFQIENKSPFLVKR